MKPITTISHPAKPEQRAERQESQPTPIFKKVTCPTCGKFFCKATPGSMVEVICNRCKTESVTVVAA